MRNWLETLTKVISTILAISAAIYYLGGNQANISNSINNNSLHIKEIKKGNDKIISLLEKVKEKQHYSELKIVENATKIKIYLEKK